MAEVHFEEYGTIYGSVLCQRVTQSPTSEGELPSMPYPCTQAAAGDVIVNGEIRGKYCRPHAEMVMEELRNGE